MPAQTVDTHQPDLRLDLLLYKEDETWVAHCLQLDVVGTGDTPDEASNVAIDCVEASIAYAFEIDDLGHLFKLAPRGVIDKFLHHAGLIGEPIVKKIEIAHNEYVLISFRLSLAS